MPLIPQWRLKFLWKLRASWGLFYIVALSHDFICIHESVHCHQIHYDCRVPKSPISAMRPIITSGCPDPVYLSWDTLWLQGFQIPYICYEIHCDCSVPKSPLSAKKLIVTAGFRGLLYLPWDSCKYLHTAAVSWPPHTITKIVHTKCVCPNPSVILGNHI